uniref:Uncharacterized protein n=1 Tax=Trypanosoma congolense (strain IL3000) TaxID=1068625 RepID=G0UP40_TRYCI|nr:conserved hypothetical protein [Trypanosoma congolense IL3000]
MVIKGLTKERDLAGAAAFEVALQHIVVRQDRSYHFVRLLNALASFICVMESLLVLLVYVLLPTFVTKPEEHFGIILKFASPIFLAVPVVCLVLLRTASQKFALESGKKLVQRLNTSVMEPCLGMKFNYASGKIRSDEVGAIDRDLLSKTDYTSQT